jgi:hypothetical protein
MDFRDLAAREMAAVVAQLFSRSEQSLRQLQAFRRSLDEAGQHVDAALAEIAGVDHDQQVGAFLDRMAAAAAAAVERATARAKADAQDLEARSAALEARARQLEAALAELKALVEKSSRENKALAASLADARRQLETLGGALDAEKGRAESARAEGAKALAARAQTEAALRDARASLEQQLVAKAALEAKVRETQDALDKQTAARSTAEAQLRELQALVDEGQSEIARLRGDLGREAGERQRVAGELDAERSGADRRALVPLDHLLDVLQEVASGTTVPEVLTGLARALARDFQRVALFNVKGSRIEGVYQSGFDFASDISKVAMPLTSESLIGHAVAANAVELRSGGDAGSKPPFGGTAACTLAMPISVHGEPLAVIYADTRSGTEAERRLKFAELLRRYAVPKLETLSAELKALAELRAYATLLLDEVEYMYSADLGAGKPESELHTRLADNLQCARQIYAQRVAQEGPAAAGLLEERLAVILEAKRKTPFGRDLRAVSPGAPRQAGATAGPAA